MSQDIRKAAELVLQLDMEYTTPAKDAALLLARHVLSQPDFPNEIKGDGPCSDCGTDRNIVWYTKSDLWNKVVRVGDYIEPTLCITCFIIRAFHTGVNPPAWEIKIGEPHRPPVLSQPDGGLREAAEKVVKLFKEQPQIDDVCYFDFNIAISDLETAIASHPVKESP